MKRGKKYQEAIKKHDLQKTYDVVQACEIIKDIKFAKFDETVEMHVNLKLTKSQFVRDTLVFPHQFKGEKRVLVFCKEDRVKEALDAGATYAGSDEYIEKIRGDRKSTRLNSSHTLEYLVCRLLLEKNFFLMIRRPPRSTPFPTRRSSDLWNR